jgi:hypothetical protein
MSKPSGSYPMNEHQRMTQIESEMSKILTNQSKNEAINFKEARLFAAPHLFYQTETRPATQGITQR